MTQSRKERVAELRKKRRKAQKISRIGMFVGVLILIGSIIFGIVRNVNRYESQDGSRVSEMEGTVVGVREQKDVEEQENAVVTVTKYHLTVDINQNGTEKMVVSDESYSSYEHAEKFIGEKRTVSVDENLKAVTERPFEYWFLIGIGAGIICISGFFIYGLRNRPSIRRKKSAKKEADATVVSDDAV